jgi:lipopolysaccharide transport system ATP-binding protein
MSNVAIRVEHLSKLYHLGRAQERHDTLRDALRDSLKHGLARVTRASSGLSPQQDSDLWALRDVTLDVKQGEVIGVIGRNGAGKSTLLKILSRITEPAGGRVELHGRVASLLEVGTGFHPELTGRENVYLNGAILGMRRREIERKFDEIVAFAEIERFLDTPVKRYSSGMYVRLAFAVAAHLEPEILLVDEVLAVGDVQFQKKCLGKMGEVADQGRTVLFVSHNMGAMRTLCNRAVLLEAGRVQLDGSADLVISRYQNDRAAAYYVAPPAKAGTTHIARVWFSDTLGTARESYRVGEPVVVNAQIDNSRKDTFEVELSFWDGKGNKLWNFIHAYQNVPPVTEWPKPHVKIIFHVPQIHVHEVFVHIGIRAKGYNVTGYLENIEHGLRYLIDEPPGETYRHMDSLFHCPAEFQVTSYA